MTSLGKGSNGPELRFGDGLPFGHEVAEAAAARNRLRLNATLSATRLALRTLNASHDPGQIKQKRQINRLFSAEQLDILPVDSDIVGGKREIVGRLATADKTDLQQFCMQNVERQDDRQAAVEAVMPELHTDAIKRAAKLVALDLIPQQVVELFERSATAAHTSQAIDSFEAGGMSAAGYYAPDDNRTGLANQFADPARLTGITTALRGTSFHEKFHAAGTTARGGYCEGITGSHNPFRLLEECCAGHAERVALSEQALPDVLRPSLRQDGGSYVSIREFVGTLATYGPETFEPSELMEGYFVPIGRSPARQEIERKLQNNLSYVFPEYGQDALGYVATSYAVTPLHDRVALVETWLERTYTAYDFGNNDEPQTI